MASPRHHTTLRPVLPGRFHSGLASPMAIDRYALTMMPAGVFSVDDPIDVPIESMLVR